MLNSYSTFIFSQIIKWEINSGFHVTDKNTVFHNSLEVNHMRNMINENIRFLHGGNNNKAHEGKQNNLKMTYCIIHLSSEF